MRISDWSSDVCSSDLSAYEMALGDDLLAVLRAKMKDEEDALQAAFRQPGEGKIRAIKRAIPRDPYADETIAFRGWSIAVDRQTRTSWPGHFYGAVGVGRHRSSSEARRVGKECVSTCR